MALMPMILLLVSCGWFSKEEPEEEPVTTMVLGEITSVHPEQGFVLFRRYGPGQLSAAGDDLLSSRSPDGKRAARLTLSPEKMGRFYTADFDTEAPSPRNGDLVILSKMTPETPSETTTDTSESAFGTKKVANE